MNLKNAFGKFVSFILLVTMLIVPNIVLAAENTSIQPRWSCIRECAHSLDRVGNDRALALCTDLEVYDGYYAGIEAQLQKYNFSTEKWENVQGKYWDYASEDTFCYIDETYISVSSGTYRFVLSFNAYSTSWFILESFECYTDQVTIP